MKVESFRIPYKVGQMFRFIPFSDVHLGSKLCSLKHFQKEIVDRYKDDPDAYFIDLGDGCDMIIAQTNDPRWKASMMDERYVGTDNPVDLLIDDYCDLLAPIAPRILAMFDSNHHLEITKRTGTNPTRRIAYKLLGADRAENHLYGYAGNVGIKFGYDDKKAARPTRVATLSWYCSHGITTGTRTEGGHVTSIGNVALNYTGVDIFAFGHNHQLGHWDRVVLEPCYRTKKQIARKLVRINTGSWKKSRTDDNSTSWEETKEFRPAALGHVEVQVTLKRLGQMDIVPVKRMVL